MSAINQALSDLDKQPQSDDMKQPLIKAEVKEVRRTGKISALLSAAILSLLLGGWAVSSTLKQPKEAQITPLKGDTEIASVASQSVELVENEPSTKPSPTHRQVNSEIEIYDKPDLILIKQTVIDKKETIKQRDSTVVKPALIEPISIAAVESPKKRAMPAIMLKESMSVQQVELTPSELAKKAVALAEKALEANDSVAAIKAYNEALGYVPSDERSRMKMSALLYGKKQLQESVKVLQQGIKRDNDSIKLRYALAQLLVKEEQPEAALSVLEYVPLNVTIEYIALRGALAQQIKHNDLAIESYRMLVENEPENGRWWLGLAITLERNGELSQALAAYQKSMLNAGLSSSSQAFARDRVAILSEPDTTTNEGVE
ncbi:tetratricopeptide repeat protein [Aliivibrio kagoshimensis]|uniref:tetratricopeptide repeat protein n=1 Tax=Aliivibrio kagoshimensis TaxID=2910230 RepID=UPI003D12E406